MRPIKSINDPRYVKAMSHPIRVRIMAILDERTATPNELSKLVGATLGTTAYHVRTLERLGLLKLVKETKVRGAIQHHYRARARPFVTKAGWEAAAPIAKQAAVSSSISVMNDYAQASAAAGGFDGGDAHLTRTLLKLDAQGFTELGKACDALVAKAEEIESRVAKRAKSNPDPQIGDVALGLMLFQAVRLSDQPPREPARSATRRQQRTRATAD
jgi:DNA-binding transcriptional ArsR family regulator